MARPNAGACTGGSFVAVGVSGTRYQRAAGTTALAVIDIGNGTAGSGFIAVQNVSYTVPVSAADFATAVGYLNGLGTVGFPAQASVNDTDNFALGYLGFTF